MQNTQEINWFLEILKIAVPSITTILVGLGLGYWLNARNEKIKAELQQQFYESQIITKKLVNFTAIKTALRSTSSAAQNSRCISDSDCLARHLLPLAAVGVLFLKSLCFVADLIA